LPGKIAYQFREDVIFKIKKRIRDSQVQALMIALTTGKRDYFDEETYDQFLGAGIVHILAVSGLHVGILYLLLIRLTHFLSFHRTGRWIRLILILNFFIFFAFLTGLTPSVLRSVVMFSVMLLGLTFNRKSPILNSVFLSAFLLLSCDPELLWQVGFQLSYSAVIGILLFHPVFQSMWQPKHKFLQGCWNLIAVSISAQLATLPLSLYYFKQFPTYFILSNLIAVPFVTFFVPGCLLFLASYFLIPLNQWISSLMDYAGQFFIWLIGLIHELPGSLISPVAIRTFDFLAISAMISLLFILLRFRKSSLFRYLVFFVGFLVIKNLWIYHSTVSGKKILAYSIAGSPVLELITGNESLIIVDTLNPALSEKIEYHTGTFHQLNYLEYRVTTFENLPQNFPSFEKEGEILICWNGKALLLSDSDESPWRDGTIHNGPYYTFIKSSHQYVLRNSETASMCEEESLKDRFFSIFSKNGNPEIEISPGWIQISF
jgi:competence protein ComEC